LGDNCDKGEGLSVLRRLAQTFALAGLAGNAFAGGHDTSSFAQESFTEDDFAQFFSLVQDGRIPAADMSARCREQGIGFTFVGRDIVHDQPEQRIFYNVSREDSSADGRTLRAKHFNASFGEWTGSVFKPLCSGLWSIGVDFDASPNTRVDLYLRKPGEERPGQAILSSSSGHLSLALPLGTGDEISTYTVSVTDKPQRTIPQATFTAYKIAHIDKYMTEFDEAAWNADVEALK
jgi:hypothetical protein